MKTVNVMLILLTAVALGIQISDVTDFDPLGDSMNMNPRHSWVKKDVSNFYDITKSKDDIFAYSGKRGIKGCVMVNRYDAKPEWLVMTCRGEGERETNNQGGLIVFDVTAQQECEPLRCGPLFGDCMCSSGNHPYCNEVNGWCGSTDAHRDAQESTKYDFGSPSARPPSNAEKPQYVNHWHGPTSVEGQAAHGNHLFTVDQQGKLHVFKNFFSTTSSDSVIQPTAAVQSSSRFLSHMTTWVDPSSQKLFGIATTGFSWSWPDTSCSTTEENKNIYQCGWADAYHHVEDLDYSKPDDHFDGVVVFDLSNLNEPKEVSRMCLKTKCTQGVSVFFDDSNKPWATVGGVNSAELTFIDLSNPSLPEAPTRVHKDHLNNAVPFYGIHPETPGYETFSNSGLSGGISVWNVNNPEAPEESAQLDEVDCSFANGAIFWNERYLLTPLASPVYGGACLFDMCTVNKPRFRSYVHFETLSIITGEDPRTTYGMNAYSDYAYFVLQHQNEMYTMEIALDKVYNHIVDDNSDIEYFETDPVYLEGYNATSCDVGQEYSEAERMNIMAVAALALLFAACCACCCCCFYCCCCKGSNAASAKQVQMTQMAGAGAAATGGIIVVQQVPEPASEGCGCCCCWDRMCEIIECCEILHKIFGE